MVDGALSAKQLITGDVTVDILSFNNNSRPKQRLLPHTPSPFSTLLAYRWTTHLYNWVDVDQLQLWFALYCLNSSSRTKHIEHRHANVSTQLNEFRSSVHVRLSLNENVFCIFACSNTHTHGCGLELFNGGFEMRVVGLGIFNYGQ